MLSTTCAKPPGSRTSIKPWLSFIGGPVIPKKQRAWRTGGWTCGDNGNGNFPTMHSCSGRLLPRNSSRGEPPPLESRCFHSRVDSTRGVRAVCGRPSLSPEHEERRCPYAPLAEAAPTTASYGAFDLRSGGFPATAH